MDHDKAFELVKNKMLTANPLMLVNDIQLPVRLSDLGFDSLEVVQLCVDIETQLHEDLPEEKSMDFSRVTVGNLVELVEKL